MGRKPNQRSPKKQSFFKVLLGDFSKHLRIPRKFTKKYIRPSLGKCSLRGPSGQCWNVELEKTENGLFFHNNGWHSFVKDHLLKIGDFLVFHYDGESKFKVKIYDRTCCEKDVEVAKRRSGCPAPPANEGNQLAGVKDKEVIDLETENYKKNTEKKTRTAGRRRRNNVMPGEGLRIEGVNETSTGSILFKSENSCFKLTLKRSYQQYVVAVPKEIAVAEGLINKKAVEIQDPTGKPWPAKLVAIKCKQNNRNQTRLDMSTGWGECCRANKISVGDTVVFEFVKKTVLQLHIFRKGLGREALLICWQIWEARNSLIFKQVQPHPSRVLFVAAAIGSSYWKENPSPHKKDPDKSCVIKWHPPQSPLVKVNFDGSVINNNKAASGFVIRDAQGTPLLAGAKNIGVNNILMTEGLALRDGLQKALENGFKKVQVEGDSKVLINCLNNSYSTPWRLKKIVEDINWLSSSFEEISFIHILREANFTADSLAKFGHSLSSSQIWNCCLSLSALNAFNFDHFNSGCCRGLSL